MRSEATMERDKALFLLWFQFLTIRDITKILPIEGDGGVA